MESSVTTEVARYQVLEKAATKFSPKGGDFTPTEILRLGGIEGTDTGYHNWLKTMIQRMVASGHLRSLGARGPFNFFRWNKNEDLWADESLVAWCLNPNVGKPPAWNPKAKPAPVVQSPVVQPPKAVPVVSSVVKTTPALDASEASVIKVPSVPSVVRTLVAAPTMAATMAQVAAAKAPVAKLEMVSKGPVASPEVAPAAAPEPVQKEFTEPELGALALAIVKSLPLMVQGMKALEGKQAQFLEDITASLDRVAMAVGKLSDRLASAEASGDAEWKLWRGQIESSFKETDAKLINLTRLTKKIEGDNESLFDLLTNSTKTT